VARNLREFVAGTSVAGLIGKDRGGEQLRRLLEECDIGTASVIVDAAFPTIVKTRIIARQQQVVRVDRERISAVKPEHVSRVMEHLRGELPNVDGIIFEDYGKGFLSAELVEHAAPLFASAGKIVTADPNPRQTLAWHNMTAVKPNRSEAFTAAEIPWTDPVEPNRDEHLRKVGEKLLEKWDTRYLLITLGEQGMMLFQRDGSAHHIPTRARQVFDVSGAGDTAIALFTLALCCEASALEAAEIANHASAVVVGKLGTATVTPQELLASFDE
jgi:D-beta-D-heptose 7-phosphate kinase/D-beta-D-heptose 1-phosphate adenosyltransferase